MIEPTKRDEEVYALLLSNRGRVTDLAAYREELLAAPAQSAEPQGVEAQRHEIRFINATPDEGYIQRILEAYIDDSYYSDNTAGLPPENEVCKMMNKWREERNALLRAVLARLASKPSRDEAPELDETALADTAYGPSGYNPSNEWQNCRDMINHIQWQYHKHAGDSGVDAATEDALASLDLLHNHYAARPSREEEMRECLGWALTYVPLDLTKNEQAMSDKARSALAQGSARDEGKR